MLNSMQATTDHYSAKLKSMFDLAIATQRYTNSFPTQSSQQLPPPSEEPISLSVSQRHQQHYSQTSPFSPSLPQNKHSSHRFTISPTNNSTTVQMEESGGIHGRSPPEANQNKSHDLCVSPVPSMDSAMLHLNYNNNNLIGGPGSLPHHNQQALNFNSPRGLGDGGDGKQRGKKQGPSSSSGNKTSFSIESLLAHSNNWRQSHQQEINAESGGGKSIKESRFLPYPVPHQTQQNHRPSPRQNPVETVGSNKTSSGAVCSSQNDTGYPGIYNLFQKNYFPKNYFLEKRQETTYSGNNGGKVGGTARRAAKSKRVRTIFTPEQLERLEAEFERQQYMVGPERLYLASSLYLTEAQVKVWFQNRRIKWRKQHLEMEQQRLALYRSLAEQDMLSSVEEEEEQEENSEDCDYAADEGEFDRASVGVEEDQRSLHSPTQQPIHSQRIRLSTHHHPAPPPAHHPAHLFSHVSAEKLDPQTLQLHNISVQSAAPSPLSSKQLKSIRNGNRMRHNVNNDDYDTCSPSTSTTSSPSSSSSIFRGMSNPKSGNQCLVQGGKK